MDLFKSEKAAPQVLQTDYFTEMGTSMEDWVNGQQEITREQHIRSCTSTRKADLQKRG